MIEQVREKYPLQYLRLIVSVLPKPREASVAVAAERMTNEELDQLIGETKRLLTTSNEN